VLADKRHEDQWILAAVYSLDELIQHSIDPIAGNLMLLGHRQQMEHFLHDRVRLIPFREMAFEQVKDGLYHLLVGGRWIGFSYHICDFFEDEPNAFVMTAVQRKETIRPCVNLADEPTLIPTCGFLTRGSIQICKEKNMPEPLQIGQPLPRLEALSADAQITTVQAHLGPQQTLLYFLHGTWCPECVGQYHLLQRYLPRIKEASTELLVITGEEIETLTAFLRSAHPPLEYTVLADPRCNTYHAIGAGDDTVSVIVDRGGIVRWFVRWPVHQGEPGYETILQALGETSSNRTGARPS